MTSGFWNFIIELFKKLGEKPTPLPEPIPDPDPQPIPDPEPIPTEIIVVDIEGLADEMYATGQFPKVRQNVYNYGSSCYLSGRAWSLADGEIEALYRVENKVGEFWETKLAKAIKALRENPKATATILKGDRRDGFGCRIGPPIAERLAEFGDRVQMGTIFPESEY
jgi:hypothetical protein